MKSILILFICLFLATNISFSKVAVIANKNVKSGKISLGTLIDIYTLDLNDLGGTKIKLFDLQKDNEIKNSFYSALAKSASEIKKIWMKKKLTGNGVPPTNVGSDDEMLSKVASTPGGIGYIDASNVNSSVIVLFEIK